MTFRIKLEPKAKVEPVKVVKDEYQLWLGDCLELMPNIESGSVDLILVDLPFGVSQNQWDSIIPLDELWKEYNRIIKPNGAIVLFGIQPFTTKLIASNLKNYKYQWYWKKNKPSNHLNAKKQPLRNIEDICVFYKRQPTYNPQMVKRDVAITGTDSGTQTTYGTTKGGYTKTYTHKYPVNLLEYSRDTQLHPTQKPVALLEYLIKTYTNEGEVVLDNTMGSGSTGVAALNLDRKFIGVKLEKEYFHIAKECTEENKKENK